MSFTQIRKNLIDILKKNRPQNMVTLNLVQISKNKSLKDPFSASAKEKQVIAGNQNRFIMTSITYVKEQRHNSNSLFV